MLLSFVQARLENELKSICILDSTKLQQVKPDINYETVYKYTIIVQRGIYMNRIFNFHINIPQEYPFKSPKIICIDKIFHPNIDENGNTCLAILKHQWTPSMGLQHILFSLYNIFEEVVSDDALNTEAAELLDKNYDEFIRIARETR